MTLTAREQQTLRAYQEFLLQRVPNQIERLVLFGSKARGDDRPDSDAIRPHAGYCQTIAGRM